LEAGLENIFTAGHGYRNSKTGQETLSLKWRRQIAENPLSSPNADKIENTLFAHFGIELGTLPEIARFTARIKEQPHGGAGTGTRRKGPSLWHIAKEKPTRRRPKDEQPKKRDLGLRDLLEAVSYARNAIAHGDTRRFQRLPNFGEGYVWVRLKNGGWSIQQAHALTGVRSVISVYNTVAHALDEATGFFGSGPTPLRSPDDLIGYDDQ